MAFRNFGSSSVNSKEQVTENVHRRDEAQKNLHLAPRRIDCLWSNKVTGMAKSQTQMGPRGIVCGREETRTCCFCPC
jgi:hypothetical protein